MQLEMKAHTSLPALTNESRQGKWSDKEGICGFKNICDFASFVGQLRTHASER